MKSKRMTADEFWKVCEQLGINTKGRDYVHVLNELAMGYYLQGDEQAAAGRDWLAGWARNKGDIAYNECQRRGLYDNL